jgi:uncharacterized Zn-binding protein involved in type VI secretion
MPQLGKRFSLVGPGMVTGPCAATVMAEGMSVSTIGDLVSPHGEPPHTSSFVISGSFSVFAEGKPVTIVTSPTSCGHTVSFGAISVFAF